MRRGPRSIPSPSPGLVSAPRLCGPGPGGLRPASPLRSGGTYLSCCPAARLCAQVRFSAGGPRGLETPAASVSEKPLRGVEQRQNHEPGHLSARVAAPPPSRTIGNYRRLPLLAPWRTRSAAPEPGLPRPIRFSACSQTPRARRDGGAGVGPFLVPLRSTPGPQPGPVRCGQPGPMEPSGTTSSFESTLHTAVRPGSRAEQRSK